jgi:ubiquinone/menaquinone biosynthesis C-methylase UbiE
MLERILYQSTPTQEFGSLALFKLLTDAQHRNAQLEITGHLLFVNGQFTQCMEGPPDSIELLWQSIQRDPRHQDIQLLMRRATDKRRFPEWSMAFSTYSAFYVHGMRGFFPVDAEEQSPLVGLCHEA